MSAVAAAVGSRMAVGGTAPATGEPAVAAVAGCWESVAVERCLVVEVEIAPANNNNKQINHSHSRLQVDFCQQQDS